MTAPNPNDAKLPFYSDRCKCSVCGEYFNSTYAFTKHRTGTYQPSNRRCLSVAEMRAAGWSVNATGYWRTEAYDVGDAIDADPPLPLRVGA